VLVLLTGCSKSPEKELEGTWYVHERFGRALPMAVTETRTFNADGSLTIERSDMDDAHVVQWSIVGEWRMRIDAGEDSEAPANDVAYRIEDGALILAYEQGDLVMTRDKKPTGDLLDAREAVTPSE